MTATEVLTLALLNLEEHGQLTPCAGSDSWISEDHTERAWAARVCVAVRCVVFDECAAAADENRETWGVWAGVDRHPQPRKPGRPPRQTGVKEAP